MKPKKMKPGQHRRLANYYSKRFFFAQNQLADLRQELADAKRDQRMAIIERDANIRIRRFLISVGVEVQREATGDFLEFRYRVHTEVMRQIRDREQFVKGIAEMIAEKAMQKWEAR